MTHLYCKNLNDQTSAPDSYWRFLTKLTHMLLEIRAPQRMILTFFFKVLIGRFHFTFVCVKHSFDHSVQKASRESRSSSGVVSTEDKPWVGSWAMVDVMAAEFVCWTVPWRAPPPPAAIHAASIDFLLIVVNASAFAVLWNWILIVLLYRQGLVRHSIYYCWLKSIIFFYVSALNKNLPFFKSLRLVCFF